MKVRCPNCGKILSVPDSYDGKMIKCAKCNSPCIAMLTSIENKVVVPQLPATQSTEKLTGNIITRAWGRSPLPFRTAFLATLGVVSALLFAYYFFGLPRWITGLRSNNQASSNAVNSSEDHLTASGNKIPLISLVKVVAYSQELETIKAIRISIANQSVKDWTYSATVLNCLADRLYTSRLSCSKSEMSDLTFGTTGISPVIAQKSLLRAMDDEIAVLDVLVKVCKNDSLPHGFDKFAERANESEQHAFDLIRVLIAEMNKTPH